MTWLALHAMRRYVEDHLEDIRARLIPSLQSAEASFVSAVRVETVAAHTQLNAAACDVSAAAGDAVRR
jgi:hypothetical protein